MGESASCKIDLTSPETSSQERSSIERVSAIDASLLIVLGFGGFSIVVALVHNAIHRYVFRDQHSLDTVFDAGGKVTTSLTAVTVASQVLWPVDLIQTSVIALKSGIGSILYFVIGLSLVMVVFPIITIHFKTKAPGAKTYPQIVYARYGKSAHLVYCCIALLTNAVTLTAMILTGTYTLEGIVPEMSSELTVLLLVFLFGSYCFIGGLGAAFYISYFNTCIMFVALVIFTSMFIFPNSNANLHNSTDIRTMYEFVKCVKGPSNNAKESLLTFRSFSGAVYGIVVFFMVLALNCCDQAMWQSRIATKPQQGVTGFFIACFLYLGIPTSLSLPSFLSYVSMSYQNGSYLLSTLDTNNGFLTPMVMEDTLGRPGEYLLIMIVFMALMATGSGEIMAISSILVYDIYKVYVCPFRETCVPSSCPLCGNLKYAKEGVTCCSCIPASDCQNCQDDVNLSRSNPPLFKLKYQCPVHGEYRHYEDMLKDYKGWCIIWISLSLVPYGILMTSLKLNVNWVTFVMETLLTPFISPLILTFTWSKCTSKGVISGVISGSLASVAALLVVAETRYDEGLSDFFTNTSADYSLFGSCISGLLTSTLITICVSMVTHSIKSSADIDEEWAKLFFIDNPLNPWRNLYEDELKNIQQSRNLCISDMEFVFRKSKRIAFVVGIMITVLLVVVLPATMLQYEELNADQLYNYTLVFFIILVLGTIYSVFVPPIEEIIKIKRYRNREQKETKEERIALNSYNVQH
ncbi:uncharacterized protein LOC133186736 [Saccostrea echinata]|uniref:uncharacterized protein LOC133186736 n=1 Tax=Saccostrea echinata TaxID=191078 RepID=UPI002A81CD1A|nr:uncharacterized protein LOC133186736 [Saccostrea echinata]